MPKVSFIKIVFFYPILVYQNCMDTRSADCYNNDWSNKVGDCAGNIFLGPFTLNETISRQFDNVRGARFGFNFTIAKIDSWDPNDFLIVFADEIEIGKFWYTPADGVDMCYVQYLDLFAEKQIKFNFPEGRSSMKITLDGNFDEPLSNEGWGAKRFILQILQPCVAFYSDCNFQGEVWTICSGNQTNHARDIPFEFKSILIENGIQVKMRDPRYYGGQTQTYTSSQYCLSSYQFPKYKQNA
ncbi:unnamed protein product (macronuclear) [Paramecium tetraurelia]|uniref:Uncharacterized protein n=1 Tax=Paramecium tetraurelia TaxID=5888 RepID=A0E7Y1_PARTE|nr:uncharacterized protein GSPATT00024126001 [Paramecium tetraurelia]CAK91398.1 unnamed protein product [Paramecium tetraurelia]|eukprot:XP_001458795.1 hypothetical protein (macronuclear) [Paramecium tetraurelia strain d4-2]